MSNKIKRIPYNVYSKNQHSTVIRKTKCERCSCLNVMEEITHFKEHIPKNESEAMCLDEILDYWCLEWELFQCYMDNNWIKCKGLSDYIQYLESNEGVVNKLKENLERYKELKRDNN